MTRLEIFDLLKDIFVDVFDDETIEISDQTTATDIDDWDSLVHIHLIMGIERSFGVKFTMSEVDSMKNVGIMADVIEAKLG